MRGLLLLTLLLGAFGLTGDTPCRAAPISWKTGRPEALRARPGKGQTLKVYPSPNGRFALVYRDEKEVGDFFWRRVYLKQGGSYVHVGSYQEIRDVRWKPDSSSVRFHAVKAVDADLLHDLEVEYRVRPRVLRWRVLRARKLPQR